MEKSYIAVRSATLSKPGDARFVIMDRQSREILDDANGRGYKSPTAAHASFDFKRNMKRIYKEKTCRPLVGNIWK